MSRNDNWSRMTVEEFTSPDPITVAPDTPAEDVLALLREHRFRHLPVVENGKVVGIISDRDLLWPRPLGVNGHLTAANVMTKNPYVVTVSEPLEAVALKLSQEKIGSAVVMEENGELYGIFTSTDALNALVELLRSPR